MKDHHSLLGMVIQHTSQSLLFVVSVLVREKERLMAWFPLLFIAILTTVSKVTSLHCSDQQLPASGDDHPQQVTTLYYCLVDNCTIERLDTAENLNIAYTTDKHIIITPKDGHTSTIITKEKYEFSCNHGDHIEGFTIVLVMAFPTLLIVISVITIVTMLVFKELRTLVGKLLILYNISVIGYCTSSMIVIAMELFIPINSHAVCYINSIFSILTGVSIELYGTSILHYTAYIMYCSSKLIRNTPEQSRRCFRSYIIYHLITVTIVLLGVVGYDFSNDNYSSIILPNGHCIYTNQHQDDTYQIPIAVSAINKFVQIVLFIAYLYYTNQLNKDISQPDLLKRQQSVLHKIALSMGAVLGVSYTIYAANVVIRIPLVPYIAISGSLFIVQQSVVATIFLCSKKMRRRYRRCLTTE